jgi:hypothetical protein
LGSHSHDYDVTISWGLPPYSLADMYPFTKVHSITFQKTVLLNNNANLPLEKVTKLQPFLPFYEAQESSCANHNTRERI